MMYYTVELVYIHVYILLILNGVVYRIYTGIVIWFLVYVNNSVIFHVVSSTKFPYNAHSGMYR